MKKLGEGGSLKSDIKKIEKLVKDKISLKHHLKVTRHNNGVLKSMVEELKTKNEEIEVHLQETKAKVERGANEMTNLKKQNEELKVKTKKLEEERDSEMKKSLQYQSENLSNRELILELKEIKSKLTTDLENCETTDANLVILNQELEECNEELEVEIKKNLQCESVKKICQDETATKNQKILELKSKNAKITSELNSGSAKLVITRTS